MLWLQLGRLNALLLVHSTHNLQDSKWHPSVESAACGHQVRVLHDRDALTSWGLA